ncbi:MAG: TlyA family RNA methyltransferase [Acidobacteria bacterium]|nr:TlyA family RNA methyltransferase [Acidobacteriota bacterium]
MANRTRLDALVVERGLAATRARARALILAGQVQVNDVVQMKAGTAVPNDARIALSAPDHPYVGRGGVKLARALDRFRIAVRGRTALDIGASTGGFSDALLQRGVTLVVALDVGRGQLDWKLRADPRVIPLEGINARRFTPKMLPDGIHAVDVVTIDVSFISLRLVLPAVPPLVAPDGDVVALVKPQFEATRREVGKGGIVRDPAVRRRVIREVIAVADAVGLAYVSATPAPRRDATVNREYFVHLRRYAASSF